MKLHFLIIWFLLVCLAEEIFCQNPDPPVLTYLSVDPYTEDVTLRWDPSPSTDVLYYIILVKEIYEEQSYVIDIVGMDILNYVHYNPVVLDRAIEYRVQAVDDQDFKSVLSNTLRTTHLSAYFDSCSARIILYWNNNSAFDDITRYYIYSYEDNTIMDSTIPTGFYGRTNYEITEFTSDVHYCYYIKTLHSNGAVSTSNKGCVYTKMADIPGYINADYATVDDHTIHLSFTIDGASELSDYYLLRADNEDFIYDTIHRYTNFTDTNVTYMDNEIQTDKRYYYILTAINNCNTIATASNIASNIVLQAKEEEYEVLLHWQPYYKWLGGVDNYYISRFFAGQSEELIAEVDTIIYIDDLTPYKGSYASDEVCYYIVAQEGNTNPYDIRGESKSNRICISLTPAVYVPTGFTPNGDDVNDTFKPVLAFFPKEYHLVIKNRWGQTVFETTDPFEEWDGKCKNNAEQGVYVYYLKITTMKGQDIVKNGCVSVIIPE